VTIVRDIQTERDMSGTEQPSAIPAALLLDRLIAEAGPIPLARALSMLARVARDIDRLHARGVVHGTVRPWRVTVGPDDAARLLPPHGPTGGVADAVPALTLDARYRSPQVLAGEDARAADDLFALGMIAWDMLAGDAPSSAAQHAAEASAVSPPDDVRGRPAAGATLPPAVADVLRAQTGAAPSGRFGSGARFVAELERAASPDARFGQPKSIAELMPSATFARPTADLDPVAGTARRHGGLTLAELPEMPSAHRERPLPRRIRRMDYPALGLPGFWAAVLAVVLCSVYLLPAYYIIRDALGRL